MQVILPGEAYFSQIFPPGGGRKFDHIKINFPGSAWGGGGGDVRAWN